MQWYDLTIYDFTYSTTNFIAYHTASVAQNQRRPSHASDGHSNVKRKHHTLHRQRNLHPQNHLQNVLPIPLRRPRLTNRPNRLRRRHTNRRPRSRRRRLPNTRRRPHANGDISISLPLLALDNNKRITQTPQRQASGRPSFVMIVESNSSATAICAANRPVLAQGTVVFRPQFVLGAVTDVVAVEGLACVVGGVVFCEGFDDVEFYERVVGEAVEREIGVACGVVVRCVVYYAVGRLGHYS